MLETEPHPDVSVGPVEKSTPKSTKVLIPEEPAMGIEAADVVAGGFDGGDDKTPRITPMASYERALCRTEEAG